MQIKGTVSTHLFLNEDCDLGSADADRREETGLLTPAKSSATLENSTTSIDSPGHLS